MGSCISQTLPQAPTSTTIDGDISGEFRPAGLTIQGKLSFVTVNDFDWTALPLVALPNRNALSIQNISGVGIKIDYVNTEPLYRGVEIRSGSERFYTITDSIIIYAKSEMGSVEILVEELA